MSSSDILCARLYVLPLMYRNFDPSSIICTWLVSTSMSLKGSFLMAVNCRWRCKCNFDRCRWWKVQCDNVDGPPCCRWSWCNQQNSASFIAQCWRQHIIGNATAKITLAQEGPSYLLMFYLLLFSKVDKGRFSFFGMHNATWSRWRNFAEYKLALPGIQQ